MRRARVAAAHRAPGRPSIRVARGESVQLGERDSDWPEFVWAVRHDGLGGWVPAALLDATAGSATVLHDYDTRELDADPGETLVLHLELAQWWWAENAAGVQGWIPARMLEISTVAAAN